MWQRRAVILCVWGGEGGRQCLLTGTGIAAWPAICFQSFGCRDAACSVTAEWRKTLWLLKSDPLGLCFFSLSCLSSLFSFLSLSFLFPLLSFYLPPPGLRLPFPPSSFALLMREGRISIFRSSRFGPSVLLCVAQPHSSSRCSPSCMLQRRICASA